MLDYVSYYCVRTMVREESVNTARVSLYIIGSEFCSVLFHVEYFIESIYHTFNIATGTTLNLAANRPDQLTSSLIVIASHRRRF